MQIRRLVKNNGFSLVEMLIAMVLFIVVIMITAGIFEKMLANTKIITKSETSNIEGVVGLEMFRSDLEKAGFGLFTDIDSPPPNYNEAATAPQSSYNDAANSVIPRAIVAENNLTTGVLTGSDYLVIKATSAALNPASQCWTSIKGSGSSKIWGANDLKESRNGFNDWVAVVSQSYKNGELQRKLIYDADTPTSYTVAYKADGAYATPFAPNTSDRQYYYYGIDSIDNAPRAPFNRTDYMVKRIAGDMPAGCSPAAGILYKSVMDQKNGSMQDVPVLDCVADMQVVLGWNTSGDPAGNAVDTYTNAEGQSPTGTLNAQSLDDPKEIRTRLKLVKVYILAQDGGFDKNFNNTNTAMRVGEVGETGDPKFIDLTAPLYRNYRWKLYRLVVRPKNLI